MTDASTKAPPIAGKEVEQECTPCKVTGVLVLCGFSAYWNHLRLSTPKSARTQRIFLGTTSLGFLGLALMRVVQSRFEE